MDHDVQAHTYYPLESQADFVLQTETDDEPLLPPLAPKVSPCVEVLGRGLVYKRELARVLNNEPGFQSRDRLRRVIQKNHLDHINYEPSNSSSVCVNEYVLVYLSARREFCLGKVDNCGW